MNGKNVIRNFPNLMSWLNLATPKTPTRGRNKEISAKFLSRKNFKKYFKIDNFD